MENACSIGEKLVSQIYEEKVREMNFLVPYHDIKH